ncbi:unnamed protein product [Prorocentrum cordatum]|uniref:Uncharacterized protein n=1 Tax=Prorocentrum cordatum TaxID=2364126 RepID=A0ABN9T5T0_9DINO|nr:unnamed protein product [Polarella glacialis]
MAITSDEDVAQDGADLTERLRRTRAIHDRAWRAGLRSRRSIRIVFWEFEAEVATHIEEMNEHSEFGAYYKPDTRNPVPRIENEVSFRARRWIQDAGPGAESNAEAILLARQILLTDAASGSLAAAASANSMASTRAPSGPDSRPERQMWRRRQRSSGRQTRLQSHLELRARPGAAEAIGAAIPSQAARGHVAFAGGGIIGCQKCGPQSSTARGSLLMTCDPRGSIWATHRRSGCSSDSVFIAVGCCRLVIVNENMLTAVVLVVVRALIAVLPAAAALASAGSCQPAPGCGPARASESSGGAERPLWLKRASAAGRLWPAVAPRPPALWRALRLRGLRRAAAAAGAAAAAVAAAAAGSTQPPEAENEAPAGNLEASVDEPGVHGVAPLEGLVRWVRCLRVATDAESLRQSRCLQVEARRLWQVGPPVFCGVLGAYSKDKNYPRRPRPELSRCLGADRPLLDVAVVAVAGLRVFSVFVHALETPEAASMQRELPIEKSKRDASQPVTCARQSPQHRRFVTADFTPLARSRTTSTTASRPLSLSPAARSAEPGSRAPAADDAAEPSAAQEVRRRGPGESCDEIGKDSPFFLMKLPPREEPAPASLAKEASGAGRVAVVAPGAGTGVNGSVYADMGRQGFGVEIVGQSRASYDRYPEGWPQGAPAPNLLSFAEGAVLAEGVLDRCECMIFGSRGGQVVLPALWERRGAAVPPAVVLNGGCAMDLPAKVPWPAEAVTFLILGGLDFFRGNLSEEEHFADARSRIPEGTTSTAVLYVTEMLHMPQASLLLAILPLIIQALLRCKSSGTFEEKDMARILEACTSGGWSGQLAYATSSGSWEEAAFSGEGKAAESPRRAVLPAAADHGRSTATTSPDPRARQSAVAGSFHAATPVASSPGPRIRQAAVARSSLGPAPVGSSPGPRLRQSAAGGSSQATAPAPIASSPGPKNRYPSVGGCSHAAATAAASPDPKPRQPAAAGAPSLAAAPVGASPGPKPQQPALAGPPPAAAPAAASPDPKARQPAVVGAPSHAAAQHGGGALRASAAAPPGAAPRACLAAAARQSPVRSSAAPGPAPAAGAQGPAWGIDAASPLHPAAVPSPARAGSALSPVQLQSALAGSPAHARAALAALPANAKGASLQGAAGTAAATSQPVLPLRAVAGSAGGAAKVLPATFLRPRTLSFVESSSTTPSGTSTSSPSPTRRRLVSASLTAPAGTPTASPITSLSKSPPVVAGKPLRVASAQAPSAVLPQQTRPRLVPRAQTMTLA